MDCGKTRRPWVQETAGPEDEWLDINLALSEPAGLFRSIQKDTKKADVKPHYRIIEMFCVQCSKGERMVWGHSTLNCFQSFKCAHHQNPQNTAAKTQQLNATLRCRSFLTDVRLNSPFVSPTCLQMTLFGSFQLNGFVSSARWMSEGARDTGGCEMKASVHKCWKLNESPVTAWLYADPSSTHFRTEHRAKADKKKNVWEGFICLFCWVRML